MGLSHEKCIGSSFSHEDLGSCVSKEIQNFLDYFPDSKAGKHTTSDYFLRLLTEARHFQWK